VRISCPITLLDQTCKLKEIRKQDTSLERERIFQQYKYSGCLRRGEGMSANNASSRGRPPVSSLPCSSPRPVHPSIAPPPINHKLNQATSYHKWYARSLSPKHPLAPLTSESSRYNQRISLAMGPETKKERRRRGNRNGETKNVIHHNKSTQNEKADEVIPNLSYKAHSTLLVQFTEETPTWYDCGRNTPGRDETIASVTQQQKQSGNTNKNTRQIVSKYRELGDEIYSHEVALARKNGSAQSDKDEKWVESTMKRGTLKDRIAAMSVVVGMDCIHKLYALDMLLDLAGCGVDTKHGEMGSFPNARVGQMASEALSDLFTNTLLPKHRKLLSLEARPLYLYEGKRTLSPRVLLLWRYEEMIKQRYTSFLTRYLGRTLSGEDEPSKKNAIVTASFLLKDIPEGEEIILPMIVNKIGDPARKIASAAGHQLRLILEEHPAMTSIVAREVSL
jgi:ribosome biogenesis protein MAK21